MRGVRNLLDALEMRIQRKSEFLGRWRVFDQLA